MLCVAIVIVLFLSWLYLRNAKQNETPHPAHTKPEKPKQDETPHPAHTKPEKPRLIAYLSVDGAVQETIVRDPNQTYLFRNYEMSLQSLQACLLNISQRSTSMVVEVPDLTTFDLQNSASGIADFLDVFQDAIILD
jgi:hypothetical protein